jgi:hypothetical protein
MNVRGRLAGVWLATILGAATLVATLAFAPLSSVGLAQEREQGLPFSLATVIDPELDTISFSIDHYGPDYVREGQAIVVNATVATSALNDVTGVDLVIRITDDPIEDRTLLGSWEDGSLALDTREVARTPVGGAMGIPAANEVLVSAIAPSDALNFPSGESGVYGVSITLERPDQIIKEVHTFTTWVDDVPQPFPVSVLVMASGSTERVDALLATANTPGVSFAVDPTVLSPEAVSLLERSNPYILTAGNVDVTSLTRASASDILDLALAQAQVAVPSPLMSATWLAPVTDIDTATVEFAKSRGASAMLAFPWLSTSSASLSEYAGDVPPSIATRDGASEGDPLFLFPDSGLSSALGGALAGSATAPARVVAETALIAKANTAANPILAVVGSSWAIESNHQSGTLTALLESPWVQATSLSTVIESTTPAIIAVADAAPTPTDVPVALVSQADAALRGIRTLATATADPQAFSSALEDALIRSLSFDRRSDPEARDTSISNAIADIDAVRDSVSVPTSSSLNLISSSGNFPVTVKNDLDVEITVTVVVESRSPILRIHDRPEVTVAPDSTLQTLIPVTAISSGNVVVSVGLENREGLRLTPPTQVSVRIHAQWGFAFTVGIASLGILLLLVGTFRTVRRGRADTRQGPSSAPVDESD